MRRLLDSRFIQWRHLKRDSRFILCAFTWWSGILAASLINGLGGWAAALATSGFIVIAYMTGHVMARDALANQRGEGP